MSFQEDESSEEDLMQRVNLFLNTSTVSSTPSQGLSSQASSTQTSLKKKGVSFSMDEEEKREAELDFDRSREELLSKIARLNGLLKEKEQQLVDEKDKRKKKEKK